MLIQTEDTPRVAFLDKSAPGVGFKCGVGFIFLLLMAFSLSAPSLAADSYQVNNGATVTIDEHSVCKKVTNNHASGRPIFVPTKTAPEWTSFRNGLPAGVTLADCIACGTSDKCVFLTAGTYTGALGTTSGAHSTCSSLASAAGLPGTYKAWIAEGTFKDPNNEFTNPTVPYRLVDGTKVADNWSDLIDGSLDAGITLDQNGVTRTGRVWTNVSTNGNVDQSLQDCQDFNNGSSGVDGKTGTSGATNSTWTVANIFDLCNTQNRLYCFQQ